MHPITAVTGVAVAVILIGVALAPPQVTRSDNPRSLLVRTLTAAAGLFFLAHVFLDSERAFAHGFFALLALANILEDVWAQLAAGTMAAYSVVGLLLPGAGTLEPLIALGLSVALLWKKHKMGLDGSDGTREAGSFG